MKLVVEEKKHSCGCGAKSKNESMNQKVPDFLALLPCGLRNIFHQTLSNKFPEISTACTEESKYVIEGNLNYEKSFYGSLDRIQNPRLVPEVFISSDINNLYHQSFRENMLGKGYFEPLNMTQNPLFTDAGYGIPSTELNAFTCNVLVTIVDTEKLNGRKIPASWDDLLQNCFEKDITLRGDKDFFCNAVFFPFYKNYGKVSLTDLGYNTREGLHPSEMVKKINNGNESGSCIYVMPFSFATKIRNKSRFQLIQLREGGIVSPVQMLIRKDTYEKHQPVIDYIGSSEMGKVFTQNGFPSASDTENRDLPFGKLWWIGQEFIESHDIAAVKEDMQNLFYKGFS